MTRIRSGRMLAAALGLSIALAVVGAQAQAAWADQPADGELVGPVQLPDPPIPPVTSLNPVFPGDLITPPDDPQPPQPPVGPGDLTNPTDDPDPEPPTTTEPPATTKPPSKDQPSGGDGAVPTPARIDTGLGGMSSQAGPPGPTVMILLVATALVILVLASICWRWTRSSR